MKRPKWLRCDLDLSNTDDHMLVAYLVGGGVLAALAIIVGTAVWLLIRFLVSGFF
jgi:hypothetical protein